MRRGASLAWDRRKEQPMTDDEREDGGNAPMDQERDASKVDEPSGEPPDKDLIFDPTMTDADEANVPPASDADPNSEPPEDDA
jgi:hypothetical protein